jgi:hypothetical protein
VSLACLGCHVQHSANVFTSQDSDSSSSSGSDTDAKALPQNSGLKVHIHISLYLNVFFFWNCFFKEQTVGEIPTAFILIKKRNMLT